MVDTSKTHSENGLVQNKMITTSGFNITISIGTGVCGESTCLHVSDTNLYPDDDSRMLESNRSFIIPLDYVDDLKVLSKLIKRSLKERKLTLIKNAK